MKHRNRQGFTIVELLVVIAIILVLIAFLFPLFISVEDKAYLVSCQSNLKQIDHALRMYATDHHGRYPGTWNWGNLTGQSRDWLNEIYSYFNVKDIRDPDFLEIVYCPSKGNYYRWKDFYYNTSYFDYMRRDAVDRPLAMGSSPASFWVLADFCWSDPSTRWMTGQFDRYAMTDPNNASRRLKTSHAEAKRNVLHMNGSVMIHNLFTNRIDEWPK
ncbi:type II secretion system protein [Planctomycetota bacterium]